MIIVYWLLQVIGQTQYICLFVVHCSSQGWNEVGHNLRFWISYRSFRRKHATALLGPHHCAIVPQCSKNCPTPAPMPLTGWFPRLFGRPIPATRNLLPTHRSLAPCQPSWGVPCTSKAPSDHWWPAATPNAAPSLQRARRQGSHERSRERLDLAVSSFSFDYTRVLEQSVDLELFV